MCNNMIWDWCVENTPDLGIAYEMFFGGIPMPPITKSWESKWCKDHDDSEKEEAIEKVISYSGIVGSHKKGVKETNYDRLIFKG